MKLQSQEETQSTDNANSTGMQQASYDDPNIHRPSEARAPQHNLRMTRGQSSVAMQIEDVYGNATVTESDQASKRQKLESLNNRNSCTSMVEQVMAGPAKQASQVL
ncbi:hypothetical protein L195_g031447 [Trifolium pratense]|uniref:Uncharacterized protein n=1 Tax=Trifolium pratense TaxID=57577 RepID=A0A2K3LAE4_TRIPR|nr:hypothetical protein L195_g031447 [Trifolium pratense]